MDKQQETERRKRKITITPGMKIDYFRRKPTVNEEPEDFRRVLTVISEGVYGVICQHETGFKETFTKTELKLMMQEGRMRIF